MITKAKIEELVWGLTTGVGVDMSTTNLVQEIERRTEQKLDPVLELMVQKANRRFQQERAQP